MTSYLLRRGIQMVMVVIVATIAIFGLLNAVPGGPLSGLNLAADSKNRFSEQEIARLEATLGLNKPFYLAYLTWLAGEDWVNEVGNAIGNPGLAEKMFDTGTWSDFQSPTCKEAGGTNDGTEAGKKLPCSRGVLRWDWGDSWSLARGQAVTGVIGSRLVNTIVLMLTVTVISLVIAIPIGIISAVKQYSRLDYAVTSFSFFGTAMPVFLVWPAYHHSIYLEISGVGLALLSIGRRLYDPRDRRQHPGPVKHSALLGGRSGSTSLPAGHGVDAAVPSWLEPLHALFHAGGLATRLCTYRPGQRLAGAFGHWPTCRAKCAYSVDNHCCVSDSRHLWWGNPDRNDL